MTIKSLIIILFLGSSILLFSQQDTLYFPVTHHIITDDYGNGGQPASMIPLIMQELNRVFAPINVQFYTYCEIDTFFFKKTYFCIFNIEFNHFLIYRRFSNGKPNKIKNVSKTYNR